jgi:hypothetical protein
MKHPFTGEYLKMAKAAKEVQCIRLDGKVFQSGDYVIFESAFTPAGMVSMIDEHSHNIPQDNAQVWLPQLREHRVRGAIRLLRDLQELGRMHPGRGDAA